MNLLFEIIQFYFEKLKLRSFKHKVRTFIPLSLELKSGWIVHKNQLYIKLYIIRDIISYIDPHIQDFIDNNNKFFPSKKISYVFLRIHVLHGYSPIFLHLLDTWRFYSRQIHIEQSRDRFQSPLFAETRISYEFSDSFRDQSVHRPLAKKCRQ